MGRRMSRKAYSNKTEFSICFLDNMDIVVRLVRWGLTLEERGGSGSLRIQDLFCCRIFAISEVVFYTFINNKMEQVIEVAAKEIGCDCLKAEQMQVISKFVEGNDVFAILPTRLEDLSIIVIVTPLTALIKDQALIHIGPIILYRLLASTMPFPQPKQTTLTAMPD
uniref:Uncharacterized protein n=1 Tax=Amphimedon queenslandica TaxID=400682 RepID=A0A1X7UWB8_AMPQE